jgi:hypothetical protein
LRISVPRSVGGWHQPQVRPHRAALFEAVGVFQRQHERKRRKRCDSLHLAQEVGFMRVVLLRDRLQLPLVVADALAQRADLLQDGLERWHERLGDVLSGSLVEASGRTFGQATTEGLERSSDVVHQLRAATD